MQQRVPESDVRTCSAKIIDTGRSMSVQPKAGIQETEVSSQGSELHFQGVNAEKAIAIPKYSMVLNEARVPNRDIAIEMLRMSGFGVWLLYPAAAGISQIAKAIQARRKDGVVIHPLGRSDDCQIQ